MLAVESDSVMMIEVTAWASRGLPPLSIVCPLIRTSPPSTVNVTLLVSNAGSLATLLSRPTESTPPLNTALTDSTCRSSNLRSVRRAA